MNFLFENPPFNLIKTQFLFGNLPFHPIIIHFPSKITPLTQKSGIFSS
ncbi:hypothetical protein CP10139811_1360, partial [Chlamydia ibidis]